MQGIYSELRAIWLDDYNLEEYIEVYLDIEIEEEESE